jgi:guanylate kinase
VLLVIAGPSGVGKGTIVARLREQFPDLWESVSYTTRDPRPDEVDGVDYRFVTREEFESLRDADGFLESFEVFGDLKGTPRGPVEDHLAAGVDVLLEIDVQGALAVREVEPDALLVFVRAPSPEEQRRRLESRGGDDPEAIERRLARAAAEEEIARARFDAVIVNDDVERAATELAAIVKARRSGER